MEELLDLLNNTALSADIAYELVEEISAASGEQRSGADQINKALTQLDQVIQQNASASEKLASMAEELSGQSNQLDETVRFFKLNDNGSGRRAISAEAGFHRATVHTVAAPARQKATAPSTPQPVGASRPKHQTGITLANIADQDGGRDGDDSEFEEF